MLSSYKLNAEDNTEATVNAEKIRLKVDSQADAEFLKSHKAQVSTPPANVEEQKQAELAQRTAEHVAKLKPIADSVMSEINFKGLSLNGKSDAQNVTADFDVSDESVANMKQHVQNYINANGDKISLDDVGKAQIKQFAENMLVLQNYKSWIINAASESEKRVRAEYHNPSPINRGNDAPASAPTTRQQQERFLVDNY